MALHDPEAPHEPHIPPQPSGPHARPLHCGAQVLGAHAPALQAWPAGHAPQLPPQPLSPQVRPPQFGVQAASAGLVASSWVGVPESTTGHPTQEPKALPRVLQVWTPIVPPGQRQAWVTPGVQPMVVDPPPPVAGPHPAPMPPTAAATNTQTGNTRIQNPMNIILREVIKEGPRGQERPVGRGPL